jgi:hypothetical protein
MTDSNETRPAPAPEDADIAALLATKELRAMLWRQVKQSLLSGTPITHLQGVAFGFMMEALESRPALAKEFSNAVPPFRGSNVWELLIAAGYEAAKGTRGGTEQAADEMAVSHRTAQRIAAKAYGPTPKGRPTNKPPKRKA